ncbi:actin-related protein 2/3 complex subunit 2 [Anaeramoeba ignava]|uniref:Arp2/3 complex 34 kDa subunit n=1 Tax=Anaeramoeba ignava TaxID=1746090 RepID=A0A9Q0L571_ANAIG|nr:actin-related protein 2/3 complex subunit 2 [Anaeramoeba ignava]
MILLDPTNRILFDLIVSRIKNPEERIPCDYLMADFDGVLYHVLSLKGQTDILIISISIKIYDDLCKYGADSILHNLYGENIIETERGYNMTIQIPLTGIKVAPEKYASKFARLKRNLFSAPFRYVFEGIAKGETFKEPVFQITYREDESFFIVPGQGQCTIIFSMCFKDMGDQVLSRVFLQEFANTQKAVRNAPPVTFSPNPPREISSLRLSPKPEITYISLVLFQRHIDGPKKATALDLVPMIRNYLHYHIKCTKAYIHIRMRARAESLLKILNRAKPEPIKKVRKTISGRTFRQK